MAASLEGVFTIIDRASPKLRQIRREAELTDASLTKLGLTMDGVASKKQQAQLDATSRSMRTLGRETEASNTRAARSFRNLDRDVRNHVTGLARLRTGLRAVGVEMLKLARPAGMIIGMGTALGVAGQAIGTLSGGVVGLLPRLADLSGALAPAVAGFTGLGVAMATTKLAFGGISQGIAGTAGAINKLTPAAARLAIQLRNMRPLLREFRRSAGGGPGGLLDSVSQALRVVKNNPRVRGTINQTLSSTSANLGGLVRDATARLTAPGALADFSNIAGQGNVIVRQMGEGVLNLGDALRHVAVAARPFTMWLSNVVLLWTKHAAVVARNGRASGTLAKFFDRTRVSLTNLGHILRNVYVTFHNLLRDARPLGNSLWAAAEKTTAGWARLTSTVGSREGLTMQFNAMGKSIKDIFNLVGELGAAIFRLGSTGGLDRTVNGLRQLVPSLEKIFGTLASTFGPAMAQTLASFGNLIADLTGATGPFTLLLTVLDKTFKLLDGIINLARPVKGIFAEAFSLAVMARFLSKLGLITIGWQRVTVAAGEAAIAQGAALGGGGGLGIGLGPVFGRGRGRGGPLAMFGRRGAARAGTGARFITGTGGVTEDLTAGSRLFGAAGAAGTLGTAGRAAAGVATRFALPLLAIQGAFGALTAGRSGNFGHQIGQTIFGAENALTGGILGHFMHGEDTPEHRAARAAGGIQGDVTATLARDARTFQGVDRLNHQIQDLQRIAAGVNDRQTQASQALIASINQEITARRQVRAQLIADAAAKGQGRATAILGALDTQHAAGVPMATTNRELAQQVARFPGHGAHDVATRTGLELAQLRTGAASPDAIVRHEATLGRRVRIAGGQIFTGTQAERTAGKLALQAPGGNTLAVRQSLEATLEAYGLSPAEAKARVDAYIANGMRGKLLTAADIARADKRPFGITVQPPGAVPGRSRQARTPGDRAHLVRHAGGGRVPGQGMQDTVALGGLAAPGELIVNRHTERRVNGMLAGSGTTLGGLVDRETMRHSEGFATGGRLKLEPGVDVGRVNQALMGDMRLLARSGNTVDITSGFRTREHQARLYAAYVASGFSQSHIAAKPGLSAHEYGMAVDAFINGSPAGNFGAAKLSNYGLVAPVGGDPVHLELLRDSPQLLGLGAALRLAGKQVANVGVGGGTSTGGTVGQGRKAAPAPFGNNVGALTALSAAKSATDSLMGLTGGLVSAGGRGGAGATRSLASAAGMSSSPPSGPGAAAFAQALAAATGLDPRVTAAWVRRENNGGGTNNWLNVSAGPGGVGYSGVPEPGSGRFASFRSPADALKETAYWINSMSNYAGIASSTGKGVQAQLAAIEASPWDATHYPGGIKLARGGRAPRWGGWKAAGVNGVYSTPTVIGVGEKGTEHVRVTPAGGSREGAQIHATFHIYGGESGEVQREVEAALKTFARHLENSPIDGQDN